MFKSAVFRLTKFCAKTIKRKLKLFIHILSLLHIMGSKTNRSDLQTIIIFFSFISSLLKLKILCTERQEQSRAVCMWQTINGEKKKCNNKSMRLVRCNGFLGWLAGWLVGHVQCANNLVWRGMPWIYDLEFVEHPPDRIQLYTANCAGNAVPVLLVVASPFALSIAHGLAVHGYWFRWSISSIVILL